MLQRNVGNQATLRLARQAETEFRNERGGQREPEAAGLAPPQAVDNEALDVVHEALHSPGRPLDPVARDFFGHRFGHDFSKVRIHTDGRSAESAAAIGAHAYTVGSDIVFAAERFDPASEPGRQLLAHELVHVVQQGAPFRSFDSDASPGSRTPFPESHLADPIIAPEGAETPQKPDGDVTEVPLPISSPSDAAEREADAVSEGVASNAHAIVKGGVGTPTWIHRQQTMAATISPTALTTTTADTSLLPRPSTPTIATPDKDAEGNALGVGKRPYLLQEPQGWNRSARGFKPSLLPPNPMATYLTLMAQVEAVHKVQRETAERLKTSLDMKYWFARVYEYVTESELAAIRANRYMYPHMKMQEVIAFQETYATNLKAWEGGVRTQVETKLARRVCGRRKQPILWHRDGLGHQECPAPLDAGTYSIRLAQGDCVRLRNELFGDSGNHDRRLSPRFRGDGPGV